MNGLARSLALVAVAASAWAEEIKVPGGLIDVAFAGPPSAAWRSVALKWVENSARAVATYYGKFPVPVARLRISSCAGNRPRGGKAFGWPGPYITISLGRDATVAGLADDWLLTHEMIHLALPSLADQHHWLEEGLATYVEPIARARAGTMTPEDAWADLVFGLPQGQPEAGDRGLDGTPTWGRTYWGGALFCLRADVAIRQRSGNRFGLEHALRAILAAGGSIDRDWSIDQVIEIGDKAVGVPVLRELYDEMGSESVRVDLGSLWRQLGIQPDGRTINLNNSAPLASVRKAITARQ
ncbi:MAG TPA: hypothetical protein VIS71_09040 [Terrimicrobium sp.]